MIIFKVYGYIYSVCLYLQCTVISTVYIHSVHSQSNVIFTVYGYIYRVWLFLQCMVIFTVYSYVTVYGFIYSVRLYLQCTNTVYGHSVYFVYILTLLRTHFEI